MFRRMTRVTTVATTVAVVTTVVTVINNGAINSTVSRTSYADTDKNTKKLMKCKCEWKNDWDMREPVPVVSADGVSVPNQEKKPKAIHQIVMIRHGQYNSKGDRDEEHVLTDLGKLQSKLTGERVKALIDGKVIYPVKSVYYSTMTRATESYLEIEPSLPESLKSHQIQPCSMIREGAVCKPVPNSPSWIVSEEDFFKDGQRVSAVIVIVAVTVQL